MIVLNLSLLTMVFALVLNLPMRLLVVFALTAVISSTVLAAIMTILLVFAQLLLYGNGIMLLKKVNASVMLHYH